MTGEGSSRPYHGKAEFSQQVNGFGDSLNDEVGPRRASGNVDIDRHDLVEWTFNHRAAIEDVAACRTGADRDDHLRIRHLGVYRFESGACVMRDRARDAQDIGVARATFQADSQLLHVIARRKAGDQFDIATVARTRVEVEQPGRSPPRPLDKFIEEPTLRDGHFTPPNNCGQMPPASTARLSKITAAPSRLLLYARMAGGGVSGGPHQNKAMARPYIATLSIAVPARAASRSGFPDAAAKTLQ